MPSPMDGRVYEFPVISVLRIAGNLLIDDELLVLLGDGPSKVLDPCFSAICRNGAIGVAGVDEDLVLALDQGVNVDGPLAALGIAEVTLLFAEVPLRHGLGDV
jgi:hypothetical protein